MEVERFKHRQLAPTVGPSSRSPANSKDLKINLLVAGTSWSLHFDINSTSWFRLTRLQLPTPSRIQIKSCSYCRHGDRGRIKFLSALESKLLRYCISASMRVHVGCGLQSYYTSTSSRPGRTSGSYQDGYQLVSRPSLGPHRRCTRVRLRCRRTHQLCFDYIVPALHQLRHALRLLVTRPHRLYVNLAVRHDYSSPGRTGSTSASPCAASTRLLATAALHRLRRTPP
jgi:hypothetical protein